MKPLIGITVESTQDPDDLRTRGHIKLNWNYFEMVSDAGGVPLVVPPTADPDDIAALIHGWLIPGGLDIDPARFGQALHPKAELQDPSRYEIESALYARLPRDVPILGICYGCQFLNVVRGGDLIQHLPDLPERLIHTDGPLHSAGIEPNSATAQALGTTLAVGQSWHHQAIGTLGQGLRVSALADDGTIEAVEAIDRPWEIGLQWHPERTPNEAATRNVFRSFIEAARAYAERRG
jgi:putative glutamine amidotransferase